MIYLASSYMGGNEAVYLASCLEQNQVSYNGPYVERFERAIERATGAGYAVATNTGTSALHIALILAGIGPGDKVAIPAITFIATANAVRYVGAEPVIVDVELDYWQMDVEKLGDYLRNGGEIRAIIPVHLHGHPVDLAELRGRRSAFSEFGFPIIEDAAESLGAKYENRPIGCPAPYDNCSAILSFNGNKIVTSGGGGAFLTNDKATAEWARHLTTQAKMRPDEYLHDEIGYNYRMTNLQAAVGLAQIETLDWRVQQKRAMAARYTEALRNVPGLTLPKEAPYAFCTYWLYAIQVDPLLYGMTARQLRDRLRAHDIEARALWGPINMQPKFQNCETVGIEVAPKLYEQALMLPSSVGLTQDEQERVIKAIRSAAIS